MTDFQVPVWGYVLMGIGLAVFVVLVGLYYVATRITGFYGIELALDLASRLLG